MTVTVSVLAILYTVIHHCCAGRTVCAAAIVQVVQSGGTLLCVGGVGVGDTD